MTQYLELYRNGVRNSALTVGDSATFGNEVSDYQGKNRYGSYNKLLINQSGNGGFTVLLDGLQDRAFEVPSTGSFSIKPEEGTFFNFVVVENSGTTTIAANDLSISYAIAKRVD